MVATDTSISYRDHLKDILEFEKYKEFLEDQTEMETVVKWLLECPHLDYLGEQFQNAFFQEVREQLEWFRENAEIKETKEEIVTKVKIYKYMEYKND